MDKCKILIVDDIPTNVALIAAIIKKLDVEHETAESGQEAIEKVDSYKPDIVLLDLMMPDVNGWDVVNYIRERYTKEQMAIIITSAINDSDNISECYDLGINDYVSKPILPERLINTIKVHTQKTI